MEKERLESFTELFLDKCVDAASVHHEFSGGMHGTKIHAERIQGTQLHEEWIDLHAEDIASKYQPLPNIILGVAWGTNIAARFMVERLGHGIWDMHSTKREGELPRLGPGSEGVIRDLKPRLVVIFDDVLTWGTNTAPLAQEVLNAGANRVVVEVTAQRLENAPKLDEIEVEYNSLVNVRDRLPTYTPEDCEAFGLCAQGVKLIRRKD